MHMQAIYPEALLMRGEAVSPHTPGQIGVDSIRDVLKLKKMRIAVISVLLASPKMVTNTMEQEL